MTRPLAAPPTGRSRVRLIVRAGVALAAASALAAVAGSASAGPAGHWTQITKFHNGAKANLGLARTKDGTLHVLWGGPGRLPYPSIFDTPISRTGVVGKPQTVLSGWVGVHPPDAVVEPDGSIHAIISGQSVNRIDDPYNGLNEAVGPGAWKLGARAFGNSSITEASNADVRIGLLPSGQLVSVWESGLQMLMQTGVDPSTKPQSVQAPGHLAVGTVVAVDRAGGAVVIAYHDANSGNDFFRQVLPGPGTPVAMPGARMDGPQIAARTGGGVYSAYTPDGSKVVLLRFGGAPRTVPVPKGAKPLTAGIAAGPEGRLWIFYGNERTTWVTRTSKKVSGFEPVQAFKSAPAVQYFRLEGEGSAGPLDLFADVTVDGQTKDGTYQTHVLPALSVRIVRQALKTGGVRVTVRVVDAGDPVAAATVSGLPGGPKTTGGNGAAVFTVGAGRHGSFAVKATKAGYVPAKGKVKV